MADDALDALRAAGFPVDTFTDEQCMVFRDLSDPELDLIIDVKRRLDEVEPEVQAHVAVAGAALY
jgi:hypothetical protein